MSVEHLRRQKGRTGLAAQLESLQREGKDLPVSLRRGFEIENRAVALLQQFQEIIAVERASGEDDEAGIDLWATCVLSESRDLYQIPVQVKSERTKARKARKRFKEEGVYRFVLNCGSRKDDDDIVQNISDEFDMIGIHLHLRDVEINNS